MKWTDEHTEILIARRNARVKYEDIAKEIGCDVPAIKYRVKVLKLPPICDLANKYSKDELLEVLRTYQSKDACPMEYRHYINKQFGSWTAGLNEAGLASKIGGVFDKTKPTTLYLLKFDGFYKIGVTQRKIEQRFSGAPKYEVLDTYCSDLDEILSLEREMLSKVERFEPNLSWFKRNGKTECFLFPFDPTFEDLL